MAKPPPPSDTWCKFTCQVRPALIRALRIRAATDAQQIREVLDRALTAYLEKR